MLPTPTDNGARLAAILPTAIASMAIFAGSDPLELLRNAKILRGPQDAESLIRSGRIPAIRSVVVVVIDGLGYANLKAASGHARTLSMLSTKRIETVIPSTTGAALTTLTTGTLPGEHGLVGYKIRHPELGLITTLKEWEGIEDPRDWQRSVPLFAMAEQIGARAVAIGRPSHAAGGLTEAILSGAEYIGGQTIADRFSTAAKLLRGSDPLLAYLYVDELDRVAHSDGWQSDKWLLRLEQLDAALQDLLRTLPDDVGIIVTADHGMVDVPANKRIMLDGVDVPLDGVQMIGGEPRMRSLYLDDGIEPEACAAAVQRALGKLAWVGTRAEAIANGWYGPIPEEVALRLGDVIVAARGQYAFMLADDAPGVHEMVGQHGSISDEERGIPLSVAGGYTNSSFTSAVSELAKLRAT